MGDSNKSRQARPNRYICLSASTAVVPWRAATVKGPAASVRARHERHAHMRHTRRTRHTRTPRANTLPQCALSGDGR